MRFDRLSTPLGQPYITDIEEVPLYHFHPGASVLVLEIPGCPLRCQYCDRPELAGSASWSPYDPQRLASAMEQLAQDPRFRGIVWGGGEPALHWDNVVENSRVVLDTGMSVIVATNGGLTADLLHDSPGMIDALLVRFKGFSDETYRSRGGPDALLSNSCSLVEKAIESGIHVELMLDVVRDTPAEEAEYLNMLAWINHDLRRNIPLHLRAVAPEHGFAIQGGPSTSFLENLVELARKQHVGFVYLSNCHGHFFNNTMCPNCFSVVIDRTVQPPDLSFVTDGKCAQCGTDLELILNTR